MVFLEFRDFEVIFEILSELYRISQSLPLSTQISHIQSKSDGYPVAVKWILNMEMFFAFPLACFKNPRGWSFRRIHRLQTHAGMFRLLTAWGEGREAAPLFVREAM